MPVLGSNGVVGYHSEAIVKGPGIVVGRKGSAGKVTWCDTDFWPIDTTYFVNLSEGVDWRWAFYLLEHLDLERLSIVTGVPGLNRNDAYRQSVPDVPLPEQQRIVEILDQADVLRKLRREADAISELILAALFYKMFGDPVRNLKGWRKKKIQDICVVVRGSSPRPKADPKFYGGPVPRLMISDLTRDGLFVNPTTDSLTEEGAKFSRPMKKGEVVMAVSGAVGLPAILNKDACIHDGFVGFRDLNHQVDRVYLVVWLNILKTFNASQAVGAIWQNLNTDQINRWELPIPPKPLQEKFHALVKGNEAIRGMKTEAGHRLDRLFNSVLHRAFTGELTAKWRKDNKILFERKEV